MYALIAIVLITAVLLRRHAHKRQGGTYHTPAHVVDYVLANPPFESKEADHA